MKKRADPVRRSSNVLLRIRSFWKWVGKGSVSFHPPIDVAILEDNPGQIIIGSRVTIGTRREDLGDSLTVLHVEDGKLGTEGITEEALLHFSQYPGSGRHGSSRSFGGHSTGDLLTESLRRNLCFPHQPFVTITLHRIGPIGVGADTEPFLVDLLRVAVVAAIRIGDFPMGIDFHLHHRLGGDHQPRNYPWVGAPQLCRKVLFLSLAAGVGQANRDRHHQTAVVAQADDGEVPVAVEEFFIPGIEAGEEGFVTAAILFGDIEFIETVVEIEQFRETITAEGDVPVVDAADPLRVAVPLRFLKRFLDIRVAAVHVVADDTLDGEVGVIGGVEPPAPEPV